MGNTNQNGQDYGGKNNSTSNRIGSKRNNGGKGSSGNEKNGKGQDDQATVMDSDFVNLNDLVYAPLRALAESNHNLRSEVIKSIQSLSSVDNDEQGTTYHLNKINIAYDQVRADVDDSYSVDKLQVQVPLLSIVPVTNLGIEESEISFSAEVRTQESLDNNDRKFEARICSPEQRNSDFLPRVTYKMKVKSIPATEGIMRLIDSLSANQVSKKLESQIIASDGNQEGAMQNNTLSLINDLKVRATKLKQLYAKIDESLDEIEQMNKVKNNSSNGPEFYDKAFFMDKKAAILDEVIKCQDEIMRKEISCVIPEETEQDSFPKEDTV